MKSKILKFTFLLLFAQSIVAELPTAQELLDTHRESRKELQQNLQEKKNKLKAQLTSVLLKLEYQAKQEDNLQVILWTQSTIRRLDELEENWLGILAEPFEFPDPVQQLFLTTANSWEDIQSSAVEKVKENRERSLEKMEKLQIRLVQEDRIDEAVITRDLREKLINSKVDEKLQTTIKKRTIMEYAKRVQKQQEKNFASLDPEAPIPPPDAAFPFQAENPAFQAYLKRLKAESSGFFASPSSHIQIGNHPVYSGFRGVAMVAYHDGKIILEDTFDTYAEQTESVRLSEAIGDLPYGAFVVIAVRDDATRRFTGSTQSSLYRLGASKGILNNPYRSSYILVGMKGLKMGGAVELFGMEKQVYAP